MTELVITILMWVALFFYFACFIPQIITNFRQKSGAGISELFLFGYLNAYLFLLFYIFLIPIPLAYRIFCPLQAIATFVLIGQRLYYAGFANTKSLMVLYLANLVPFICLIPYALKNPLSVGIACGWGNFLVSVVNQLPQVVKIYRQKSVEGFSFLFVVFFGIAAVCESLGACTFGLPLPTCFNAFRGVIVTLIFCLQFLLYKK